MAYHYATWAAGCGLFRPSRDHVSGLGERVIQPALVFGVKVLGVFLTV